MRDYGRGDPGDLRYRDGARTADGRVREYYFAPPAEWDDDTVALLDRIASWGGPVLDAGCGAGKHALWLQDRGVDVTGIDASPAAVEAARERGVDDARVMDMFDPAFERDRFRTAFAFGTQVGLAGSLAGVRDLLAEFARLTDEDGRAVVHNYDPAAVDEALLGYRPDPREGIARRCFHFEYEPADDRDPAREVGPTLQFLLFGPDRLADATIGTPWTVADVDVRDRTYAAVLERE